MKLTDDLRQATLSISRQPGFLLLALATLSIGIASTLTIFSIVDHVILRPWPFPEPDRLVAIDRLDREKGERTEIHAYPDFVDLREQMKGLDGLTAYATTGFFLDGEQGSELLSGFRVSADFVSTLGIGLAAGRGFESTDMSVGASVGIVSSRLANALFSNPTDAVGARVHLSDAPFTIIGVVAEPLLIARESEPDLLVPLIPEPSRVEQRRSHWLRLIGRRSEGVSLRELQSELDAVAAALAESFPRSNADRLFLAAPLTDRILGPATPALYILLAAVALLLLVACANVANLLVVRAVGRQRKVAMRMVMGAGRMRLLRQLFAENVILALIAAVVSVLLVKFTLGTVLELLPAGIPFADRVALDTRLVVFSIGLALLTTVFFGALPAFQATRSDLFTALRQGHGESRGQSRLRNLLVVNEIASVWSWSAGHSC